jgi:hypothetical protein
MQKSCAVVGWHRKLIGEDLEEWTRLDDDMRVTKKQKTKEPMQNINA